MWPISSRTRYKKPGRAPFEVVHAWPLSQVRAPIWVNGNSFGGKKVTFSIRKAVPKSDECPSGFSTVFEPHESYAVKLCAENLDRRLKELKDQGII